MDPARPIQHSNQDAFERLSFAKHLAGFLCLKKDDPSIVVGIEGKWGDGKTSCINLVKEVISENTPRPIIVTYRPWLISTLDSMIEGFFVELASALGTQSRAQNAKAAAHRVLQFGKMLAPIKLIPGVEPWGSIVEKVLSAVGGSAKAGAELSDLSLQAKKIDLQKSLQRINRPIVVIIDDADRLPPEHVRIVFQMLKAVCDFDRVSYLVAYDPKPIKKALSYGEVYEGERYLEKIVQVSYPLPRLSFTHMKDYVQTNVQALAEQYDVNLKGVEGELFDLVLNKTDIVRVFETPRDVIRLCNRLRLSASNTRNEVSFSDLVAFETLELKFQELSQIIRSEPDRFVATLGVDEEFVSKDSLVAFHIAFAKEEEEKTAPIDVLFQRVSYDERKSDAAKSILLFLFPRLGGEGYPERDIPESINRVKNRDAFLKLLHCGVTSFTYSSKQAQRFCMVPEERPHILAEYRDANDLYNWIGYLANVVENSEIEDAIGLCDLLLDIMQGADTRQPFKSMARDIGRFLYQTIKTRKDHAQRIEMLDRLVSSRRSLSVSESTLLQLLNDYGIWKKGKYIADLEAEKSDASWNEPSVFSYEELYSAKDRWLESMRDVAGSGNILKSQKDILSILHRWGQLNNNDYSEPQAYVIKQSTDNEWLQEYLRLFHVETNAKDMLPFISDDSFDDFIERVTELSARDEHAGTIAGFLCQIKEAKDKEKHPTSA